MSEESNGNGKGGDKRILVAIIVALISAHYTSVVLRLDRMEVALVEIRRENADAAIKAALAVAAAAQALATAATASSVNRK